MFPWHIGLFFPLKLDCQTYCKFSESQKCFNLNLLSSGCSNFDLFQRMVAKFFYYFLYCAFCLWLRQAVKGLGWRTEECEQWKREKMILNNLLTSKENKKKGEKEDILIYSMFFKDKWIWGDLQFWEAVSF